MPRLTISADERVPIYGQLRRHLTSITTFASSLTTSDALGHQPHRLAGTAADVQATGAGGEPDPVEQRRGLRLQHAGLIAHAEALPVLKQRTFFVARTLTALKRFNRLGGSERSRSSGRDHV